jgi:hypothetical protein
VEDRSEFETDFGIVHEIEADQPVLDEVRGDLESSHQCAKGDGVALGPRHRVGKRHLDGVIWRGGHADATTIPLVEYHENFGGFLATKRECDVSVDPDPRAIQRGDPLWNRSLAEAW